MALKISDNLNKGGNPSCEKELIRKERIIRPNRTLLALTPAYGPLDNTTYLMK